MILPLALLLIGAGLLYRAIFEAGGDFSLQGPRLAPVAVTAAWVVVAAVFLIRHKREKRDVEDGPGWLAPLGVVASLSGFAVALEYAGFVVSAFLFILVVSRVLGSRSLSRDLIVAVVLPLAIYLPFTQLLDIFLPAGVFPL